MKLVLLTLPISIASLPAFGGVLPLDPGIYHVDTVKNDPLIRRLDNQPLDFTEVLAFKPSAQYLVALSVSLPSRYRCLPKLVAGGTLMSGYTGTDYGANLTPT